MYCVHSILSITSFPTLQACLWYKQMMPSTRGNGWFVSGVKKVSNANEEFLALGSTPLNNAAVVAPILLRKYRTWPTDTTATVQLTHYAPNELRYLVESEQGGLWSSPKSTTSRLASNYRWAKHRWYTWANYILRAIEVPAGRHEVLLTFKPTSIKVTEGIAYGSIALLLLALLGGFFLGQSQNHAEYHTPRVSKEVRHLHLERGSHQQLIWRTG